MYAEFDNIETLKQAIDADKLQTGSDVSTRLRYPIRFILFDNFHDSYALIYHLVNSGNGLVSAQEWMEEEYKDVMLTSSKLCNRIEEYIRSVQGDSVIVTPFSELARFYDNDTYKDFDSLISTLKTIETTDIGWSKSQRVYIPIVGLQGKMARFFDDPQIFIWYQKSSNPAMNYHLLLTNNTTFGVKNLHQRFTVVENVYDWLNYWKAQDKHEQAEILCLSPSIYAHAANAQPDNAFTYTKADNVYQFLTEGLQICDFGIEYQESEEEYWKSLAEAMDLSQEFKMQKFFAGHFSIEQVPNAKIFIELWFKYHFPFSRWLLSKTYAKHHKDTFLAHVLSELKEYSDQELLSNLALTLPSLENDIQDRLLCMNEAAVRERGLSEEISNKLARLLQEEAERSTYHSAMKYFTSLTKKEKELAIDWLGKGLIQLADIKHFYIDLYYYMQQAVGTNEEEQLWVLDYIDRYKQAKIADRYTPEVKHFIETYNGDTIQFLKWNNLFKTTRAHLDSRGDIEVFFWVDGLGIDWIPLIIHIIEEFKSERVYLNDVRIACCNLPSITPNNKAQLEKLAHSEEVHFEKLGDIDSFAHQPANIYPYNIIEEIELVRKSIMEILKKFIGKKIAIVSDHGISYLSQLQQGLNLTGYDVHHAGRYATADEVEPTSDSNYYVLEDGKTICALNHRSLGAKTPKGLGAHGGCTPEEVLVPIFIISSSPNAKNWTITWMDDEISAIQPIVHVKIKGLTSLDIPVLQYGGKDYRIKKVGHDMFESERIELLEDDDYFSVRIGDIMETKQISVNVGSKEQDMFGDLGL